MHRLRPVLAVAASAALAGTAILLASSSASASIPQSTAAHLFVRGMGMRDYFERVGLTIQENGGYLAAQGPADVVKATADTLELVGVGNTALYTGAGQTGDAIVIVAGNDLAQGTDFQVMNMTAANVQNDTDQDDVVYSDNSDDLDATVPAGTDADITPVDVDYAAYPKGSTPPPDNRGLNPSAQFTWGSGK